MQHAVKDAALQKQKSIQDSSMPKQLVRPTPPNVPAPLRPASSVSTQTAQIQNISLANTKPVKVKSKQLNVKACSSAVKTDISSTNLKSIHHNTHQTGNNLQNKLVKLFSTSQTLSKCLNVKTFTRSKDENIENQKIKIAKDLK